MRNTRIKSEVDQIELKAFTVEFRTRGKLGLCSTSEHVPWAREILFVGVARKVMSVQVTDIFNFRKAAAFLIILQTIIKSRANARSALARLAISARKSCTFGEGIEGSPNAYHSETHPKWNVETQRARQTRHRDRNTILDGLCDDWVLQKVAHHLDTFDYIERLCWMCIRHFSLPI